MDKSDDDSNKIFFRMQFWKPFMWMAIVAASIYAGVITWQWVDPDGILGFIGFLLLWGILSLISRGIIMGIFMRIILKKP